LLTPAALDLELPRPESPPIVQVHRGSRDLHWGGFYRPDHAGYNDVADVVRLSTYLEQQRPEDWRAADLASLEELPDEVDRLEELADLRAWWPALVEMYRRATDENLVAACEEI